MYASMQVNFWIGATDQTIEGGWSWTDGSPFRFLNWYPGKTQRRCDCVALIKKEKKVQTSLRSLVSTFVIYLLESIIV